MTEENNILFDRYLSGEMSAVEMNSFQEQLSLDSTFKADFELYESMLTGIKSSGRESILSEIKSETSSISPKKYNPSSKGGFNFFPIFGLGVVLSILAAVLLYGDYIPSNENQTIIKSKEWLHQWDEQINTIIRVDTLYDTVYQYIEIEDPNVQEGDTIFVGE